MDGYALRSSDLKPAGNLTDSTARKLAVVETVAAGSFPSRAIGEGETMRVMTGAPVPAGADSVVRREDTDEGRVSVSILNLRDLGKNIRHAGEDFRAGDLLFDAGEALRVAHVGVLASAAIREVHVHRRPRVALISSGDELVMLDDFTTGDAGNRIVSSNSLTLASLVREAGGEPVDMGIARDNPGSVREKLELAHDADLIVTSAGLSVGDHDHVRDVFAALGGDIDFWKVRMRPGAPLAFGFLGNTPWIGLSGNPVSAMVTFDLFVRPVIRKMLGFRTIFRRTLSVTLSQPVTLAAPLMHFLRATVTRTEEGHYMAELAGSQSSSVLTTMAAANALLILPGDRLELPAGELLRALPLGDTLEVSEDLVLQ